MVGSFKGKWLDYSLRDLLCPLESNVGIWNFILTFDQSSADSGGIILSGIYLYIPAMTAEIFLEFAALSGIYLSAAVIKEERTFGGRISSPLMTPLISGPGYVWVL